MVPSFFGSEVVHYFINHALLQAETEITNAIPLYQLKADKLKWRLPYQILETPYLLTPCIFNSFIALCFQQINHTYKIQLRILFANNICLLIMTKGSLVPFQLTFHVPVQPKRIRQQKRKEDTKSFSRITRNDIKFTWDFGRTYINWLFIELIIFKGL